MQEDWDLLDINGQRKYLTQSEREVYFSAIDKSLVREKRTFALLLYYTGCRVSEATSLKFTNIDFASGCVILKTLKQRKVKFRSIPVPESFLIKLDDVHKVKDKKGNEAEGVVWGFKRRTAYSAIKKVMATADIEGKQATPKGLRHSFVIAHLMANTPQHVIQSWMGWSSTDMFAVYGKVIGMEERQLASAIWK
jgi:integrase/recombinase XerD